MANAQKMHAYLIDGNLILNIVIIAREKYTQIKSGFRRIDTVIDNKFWQILEIYVKQRVTVKTIVPAVWMHN